MTEATERLEPLSCIMEAFISIIIIGWSILGIILFFKIWGMTNNVKEIHDKFMGDKLKKQHLPNFTPYSERGYDELEQEAIKTRPSNGKLKKGDKVTIVEYGTCIFEGVWQGQYAFYPENKTDLPKSLYLVDDEEPYLLIPYDKLEKLIV